MTETAVQETTEEVEDDTEVEDEIPFYQTVWELLERPVRGCWYNARMDCDEDVHLLTTELIAEVDEDPDEYVAGLEQAVLYLNRQRYMLAVIIEASLTYGPMSVAWKKTLWSNDFVKKMVTHCLTGGSISDNVTSMKFFNANDPEEVIAAYEHLPVEWKPRAAAFIQTWMGNTYSNEFGGTEIK